MPACTGCLKEIDDRPFLNCRNCQKVYDLFCANVSEDAFQNHQVAYTNFWKCPKCKSIEPRSDNTNTPVRSGNENVTMHRGPARAYAQVTPKEPEGDASVMEISFSDSTLHHSATLDATLDTTRVTDVQLLVAELRLFREELRAVSYEIHALRSTMTNLASRLDSCDARIDSVCARVQTLESRPETSVNNVLDNELVDTVAQLKLDLNDRDQDLLLNDLEMSSVPEHNGENATHVVLTLAQKLGVPLTENDIVDASRVGRAPLLEDGFQGPAPRPRPLVVRLARRAVRDRLLQAARVRRGATTEDTGLPGPAARFYVNERLTPFNRRLFQKARELKHQHAWRFVWTRDGRIFMRQRSGFDTPRLRIRSEHDLDRVFGPIVV